MRLEFVAIFEQIKPIYARYEKECFLIEDIPGKYSLGTHEVRAKDRYRTWFGGVEIKKSYVSAHLIPVYAHPELLEGISDRLRKQMQGKSCFNFKTVDSDLFAELEQLVEIGFRRFRTDGRV